MRMGTRRSEKGEEMTFLAEIIITLLVAAGLLLIRAIVIHVICVWQAYKRDGMNDSEYPNDL